MIINITCFKIPGSGFIFVASEYPSMTNKEIIQYTNVLFTQAPNRVCLHGTNIDSRTIPVGNPIKYHVVALYLQPFFVMYITTTMWDDVLHCLWFAPNVFLVSLHGD